MRKTGFVTIALLGAILMVSGCSRETTTTVHHPATLEETGTDGIKKVTLEPKAVERTGIETAEVKEERVTVDGRTMTRRTVPYGAIMYDKKGGTWVYTNPDGHSYVRASIDVDRIVGDTVILNDGPDVGTVIVTVGAAELMGAEHNYGH